MRELIVENAATVKFLAPDVAYADARKYLPALLEKRGVNSAAAMAVLDILESIVCSVELELYAGLQQQALQRIAIRDADDWPVIACAMTMGCPVWTEDADFFGTGVATWTTDRVKSYLVGGFRAACRTAVDHHQPRGDERVCRAPQNYWPEAVVRR